MPSQFVQNYRMIILSILIIAITSIAYSNTLKNEFVWDDIKFIVESPYAHSVSKWQEAFSHNVGYSSGARNFFYRPLYTLINAVNYQMGQGTPLAFHFTNIVLHASCAVLVLLFLYMLSQNLAVSAAASAVFAIHPVQTQAIAYIAGRADPLFLFFSLLSLIGFLIYRNNRKSLLIYSLSVVSFILALLSKEMAAMAPVYMMLIILILDDGRLKQKTRNLKIILPYAAVLCVYLLLRLTVLNFSKESMTFATVTIPPFSVRALTACKAVFLYFRYLLLPAGFHMEMSVPYVRTLSDPTALIAVFGILGLAGLIWYIKDRNRLILFGLAWFFIGLIPVLNLFPINAVFAVHWMYLPSIGIFFAIALWLWNLIGKKSTLAYTALVTILCLALSFMTFLKNREWKNAETLYENILKHSKTARIYVNRGNAASRERKFDEAIEYYNKALEIAPKQTEVYVNLGYIYNSQGEFKKAEKSLSKAIALSPKHANAHFNLAVTYVNRKRYKESIDSLKETLKSNPNHYRALNVMGEAYIRSGNLPEAKAAFSRSISIKSDQPKIQKLLKKMESIR